MRECHRNGTVTTPSMWASWLALHGSGEACTNGGAMQVEAASGALPPPGIEALVTALSVDEPDLTQLRQALAVFAWERVAATSDLRCAMRDVDALWDVLESSHRPSAPLSREHAHHCLVDAWVDAVAADRGSPGIDPLSGLHTVGYLYGRVRELDRLSGEDPCALMLIAVRWSVVDGPWMRIARVLQVASALRCHVRPEATVSQIGTTLAVALVPDDARSRLERIALTKALETDELAIANPQVDVFAVPDDRSELPELVTRLRPGASVDVAGGRQPGFRHTPTTPLD